MLVLSIILNIMAGFCFNITFVFADDGVAINEENFPDDTFREYVRRYGNIDIGSLSYIKYREEVIFRF